MKNVTFRPATDEDAAYVGVHLRESDRLEVLRSSGNAPSEAPLKGLRGSIIAWTMVCPEGRPLAVFGVAPDARENAGVVWLLGTPEVSRFARTLVRAGRYYVGLMNKLFPVLHNCVDAENVSSLRWLEALGFSRSVDTIPSRTGHPFFYVHRHV